MVQDAEAYPEKGKLLFNVVRVGREVQISYKKIETFTIIVRIDDYGGGWGHEKNHGHNHELIRFSVSHCSGRGL